MEASVRPSFAAEVVFERHGPVATIVLNRGEALNALTHVMCIDIDRKLAAWQTIPVSPPW